jgi:glucose/arabinose dehydrogenase
VVVAHGKIFVTTIGEFGKDGDGAVVVIDKGKVSTFCGDLDDPKGIAVYQQWLFVADKKGVWKIDQKGKAELFAAAGSFPAPPLFFNDVVVDPESGVVYVSDSGDLKGKGGAVYRIDPKRKISTVATDGLHTPNGLVVDGAAHLLLLDFGTGTLSRLRIANGKMEKLAEGLGGGDGLAWDMNGQLFITDWQEGQAFGIFRPGEKPVKLATKFESAADLCYDPRSNTLLIPDMKAGTVSAIPAVVPGFEVDKTPLPIETTVAFPKLKWTDWSPENEKGVLVPHRPIVLTHAGDGSNRNFVATQHGVIHVFPNDVNAAKTSVFLNIEKKVLYKDEENEQGLLGVAFHPKYKANGEFFVFYTVRSAKLTNILSRFKVSKDDPNRADPASEEEILRIERPFWNHDGGTIVFGPDGYLYVALGDGGAANDPFNNAQNRKTILGDILRIDIDHKEPGKAYAIPKDNPFVGETDVRPEIWAYGLRNVWRMAFDRKTGALWAGDVGQNLYEEIDIITKGGNYGWKLREGLHPFSPKGVGVRSDLIDPIWEYHHDVGKSITGGLVYRGQQLPKLQGVYLYADYVTGRIWALRYDAAKKRVVANQPIRDRNLPIMSFGEDERGEAYVMTYSVNGQGIYRFIPSKNP